VYSHTVHVSQVVFRSSSPPQSLARSLNLSLSLSHPCSFRLTLSCVYKEARSCNLYKVSKEKSVLTCRASCQRCLLGRCFEADVCAAARENNCNNRGNYRYDIPRVLPIYQSSLTRFLHLILCLFLPQGCMMAIKTCSSYLPQMCSPYTDDRIHALSSSVYCCHYVNMAYTLPFLYQNSRN